MLVFTLLFVVYRFNSASIFSLCHSFIVDPNDLSCAHEGIFTKDEQNEIRMHAVRELPTIPEKLSDYMMTFAVVFFFLVFGL